MLRPALGAVKQKPIAVLWALACVAMLAYIVVQMPQKDADIVFVIGMGILCFPISIVITVGIAAALGAMLECCGIEFKNTFPFYISVWLIYFAAGFIQWFVVFPKLFRRRKPS
jgi:hypothetical protein